MFTWEKTNISCDMASKVQSKALTAVAVHLVHCSLLPAGHMTNMFTHALVLTALNAPVELHAGTCIYMYWFNAPEHAGSSDVS